MEFNVAQLLKQPTGNTRQYEINENLDDLDPELVIQTAIKGKVKFTKIPKGILVTANLNTRVELSCNRCLDPFDQSLSIELEEQFRPFVDLQTGASLPQSEEDEEATQISEKNIIDLSEVTRQALLIAVPTSQSCRLDCKGLCQRCGKNLNEASCICTVEEVDPRWEALRSLLDQES